MSDKNTALANLENALGTLERFLSSPVEDDRDEAGIIQSFEFAYELCWKSIQKYAESQGARVATPKQAFSLAIRDGIFPSSGEETWLRMLADRNLTSHTYKREIAKDVLSRIPDYLDPMNMVLKNLKHKWKS